MEWNPNPSCAHFRFGQAAPNSILDLGQGLIFSFSPTSVYLFKVITVLICRWGTSFASNMPKAIIPSWCFAKEVSPFSAQKVASSSKQLVLLQGIA